MAQINSAQANQIAGKAIARAFVDEAKNSPLGEIKAEYQAFLGTLSADAQKAFDGFINDNAPEISEYLGVDDKLERQAFRAKSDAIWQKYGARDGDRMKLFTDVFGPEVVQGRESHQLNFNLSQGPNGEVVGELGVWKPKPNDSAFEVLLTETLASATLTFAADGSYTIDSKSVTAAGDQAGDLAAAKKALDAALRSDAFCQENKVLEAAISDGGELVLPSMVMWHTAERLQTHINQIAATLPELTGVTVRLTSQNPLE